MTTPSSS